jgi:hypothetical protein
MNWRRIFKTADLDMHFQHLSAAAITPELHQKLEALTLFPGSGMWNILNFYKNDDYQVIIAWFGEQVAGWATYSEVSPDTFDINVITDPEMRGKHVGKSLLSQIRMAVGPTAKLQAYPFDDVGKKFFESPNDPSMKITMSGTPNPLPSSHIPFDLDGTGKKPEVEPDFRFNEDADNSVDMMQALNFLNTQVQEAAKDGKGLRQSHAVKLLQQQFGGISRTKAFDIIQEYMEKHQ